MAGVDQIVFVPYKPELWRDLLDDPGNLPSPDSMPERFISADDVWVVQTYLRCARAGLNCVLRERAPAGSVAVVSYALSRASVAARASSLVVCQHDRPRPHLCSWRVTQNQLGVRGPRDVFIPHWPQPGLKPRDPSRGDRVEVVGFKGVRKNLAREFRTDEFAAALRELGMELRTEDRELRGDDAGFDWTDYREVDVLLAVRDDPPARLAIKPASKLINAWHAGIPAILGVEPAYRELRRSDLDYLEVSGPADAVKALRRLRDEPGLHRAMVEHGRARGQDFTAERITAMWVSFLRDRVLATREPPALVRRARIVMSGVPRHWLAVRRHRRAVAGG